MATQELLAQLGCWEGYEVEGCWEEQRGAQRWCVVRLRPVAGRERECSGCGERCTAIHDCEERRVRDLPIFEIPVELIVPRVRVGCLRCGAKLERLAWLEGYSRVTKRLANSVARMCQVMSIRHVAKFYGLSWSSVKLIDWRHLDRDLGPPDFSTARVLGMDEFALHKGHRYATVVVEVERKRVLWVGRGRGREDVRPFFQLLGPNCQHVQAVVMDMNTAYELEVRAHCPQAQVVFDLFHVVAKYGREVIDRVRVDEANRLRHDRPARRLVKGARWLLLRNRDNVDRPEDQVRLQELLDANRALLTVYVLKDDLKALWDYRHSGYAKRFWDQWYRRAMRSRLEPLKVFARRLKGYLPGILAHCQWPLGTNLIEGMNNRIKVIKRTAYGFRDEAYFFLKIRAAFPGVR
jgi:transposase